MKRNFLAACLLFSALLVISCSKDDDSPGDPKVNHVGEKWNITSVTYNIVDQSFNPVSQSVSDGTATNAGAFYFDGSRGSFDIQIEDYHKEDYFSYTDDANGVSIVSVNQSAGSSGASQFAITLDGQKPTATTMTLDGTIMKQSQSGQFLLTATFVLTKN
jgi:hypothetical protein